MIVRFRSAEGGREERRKGETDRPRIPIQISTRESLIRAIEESVMSLLQKYIRKLAPLVLRWVHTSGIMRACVQEEHGAVRGGLKRVEEAVKVKPDG